AWVSVVNRAELHSPGETTPSMVGAAVAHRRPIETSARADADRPTRARPKAATAAIRRQTADAPPAKALRKLMTSPPEMGRGPREAAEPEGCFALSRGPESRRGNGTRGQRRLRFGSKCYAPDVFGRLCGSESSGGPATGGWTVGGRLRSW